MLSRVADNLYWMRRYVERGDQIARVVGVNFDLAFDRAPGDVARLWGRLLSALWSAPEWAQVERAPSDDALGDLTSIDAVAACFAAARENARQVRQHISAEMWERINGLHLTLNDPATRARWAERPHGYFQAVRDGAALFDAAVHAGVSRDEGWHFLQLGAFLERGACTARLLGCQMREARPVGPDDALDEQLEWICLLRACDALGLYRQRCGAELLPDRIVRFLIADPLSPRSVCYALDEIARALAALAAAVPSQPPILVTCDLTTAAGRASPSGGDDPMAVVSAIEAECNRIHRAVYDTYIDYRRSSGFIASEEVPWTTR
ncbi:MAG: alpha-E domain-containing protein [Acidobacteriota bacterium]